MTALLRPNEGMRVEYQRELEALIDTMDASLSYWIIRTYRRTMPILVTDSAADVLSATILAHGKRWVDRIEKLGPQLARKFARVTQERVDAQAVTMMRTAGFTVRFKMTPGEQSVVDAIVHENVALIRSIAEQHLSGVEQAVMRSVQRGRDMSALSIELREVYGVTHRRAAFIARDQNSKATGLLARARFMELGLTEGVWKHSGGGKVPRPEHVAMSGQRFNLEEGAFLEGVWTWPGVEINCRCVLGPYIPGVTVVKGIKPKLR